MTVKPGERPKKGQHRERKIIGQTLYLRCYGPFHDGEWLSADRFTPQGRWHCAMCRECRAYVRAKQRGGDSYVKLSLVRKWLEEVVHRCGTYNSAARTIGVTEPTIFKWLGRHKGYEQKRISRSSVQRILETLGGLRNGTITPSPTRISHGRKYKYGCSGCGCNLDLNTPGCKTCKNRRTKITWQNKQDREILRKKWREDRRKRMERLTKAA